VKNPERSTNEPGVGSLVMGRASRVIVWRHVKDGHWVGLETLVEVPHVTWPEILAQSPDQSLVWLWDGAADDVPQTYRCLGCGGLPRPRRDDPVSRWLRSWRNRHERDTYWVLDEMLEEYRLCADTGVSLDRATAEREDHERTEGR
jgi:hypothetical protein